jgi:hypothetical protein
VQAGRRALADTVEGHSATGMEARPTRLIVGRLIALRDNQAAFGHTIGHMQTIPAKHTPT